MTAPELHVVRVSDIAEFPTDLGNRCSLLQELGLNAYRNTEEELLEALTESARRADLLEICLRSSRCRRFYETFREGRTPFADKDPIRLLEHGGRYWVVEGKHRVCLAKRAGVEALEAYVWSLPEDTESLLPREGAPGRYVFKFTVGSGTRSRAGGEAAVLWVKSPPGMPPSRFDFGPVLLDERQDTGGRVVTLFPGLAYRVSVGKAPQKTGLFGRCEFLSVEAEVNIEPDHARTRIWLLKAPAGEALSLRPAGLLSLKTVYRFGCWRQRDFRVLSRTFLGKL